MTARLAPSSSTQRGGPLLDACLARAASGAGRRSTRSCWSSTTASTRARRAARRARAAPRAATSASPAGCAHGLRRRPASGSLLVNDDAELEPGAAARCSARPPAERRRHRRPARCASSRARTRSTRPGSWSTALGVAYDRLAGAPARRRRRRSRRSSAHPPASPSTGARCSTRSAASTRASSPSWRTPTSPGAPASPGWRCALRPARVAYHHGSATAGEASALKYLLVGRNRMRLLARNATGGQLVRWGWAMALYDLAYVAFVAAHRPHARPAARPPRRPPRVADVPPRRRRDPRPGPARRADRPARRVAPAQGVPRRDARDARARPTPSARRWPGRRSARTSSRARCSHDAEVTLAALESPRRPPPGVESCTTTRSTSGAAAADRAADAIVSPSRSGRSPRAGCAARARGWSSTSTTPSRSRRSSSSRHRSPRVRRTRAHALIARPLRRRAARRPPPHLRVGAAARPLDRGAARRAPDRARASTTATRLRSVHRVVPFGVPDEPPVAGGRRARASASRARGRRRVVLWNGGLWNWLDAPTARPRGRAARRARGRGVRLVFMGASTAGAGGRRPRRARGVAARARACSTARASSTTAWVPYARARRAGCSRRTARSRPTSTTSRRASRSARACSTASGRAAGRLHARRRPRASASSATASAPPSPQQRSRAALAAALEQVLDARPRGLRAALAAARATLRAGRASPSRWSASRRSPGAGPGWAAARCAGCLARGPPAASGGYRAARNYAERARPKRLARPSTDPRRRPLASTSRRARCHRRLAAAHRADLGPADARRVGLAGYGVWTLAQTMIL